MDKGSTKERLIIKLVCVLLSFCLWIYVTNVETIVKTYTLKGVPVTIVNTEALKNYGLALAPGQTFDVNLNLEGPSKDIYSVKKSDFIIRADLSEYALKKGENNIPVQIINYPQQINIKNNGYLIVKVNLEALETKTFNSVSNVSVNFASNVYKDKVNFTSEKVEVSGPESAVNSVTKVALVGSLDDVAGPITKTFNYEPLDANGNVVKDVELSQKSGTISVATNVGKKVELTAEFTGNLPNGVTLNSTQLSQNYVNIIGNKDVLNGISSLKLTPIDLTNITQDTVKTVNIQLPEGVQIASGNNTVKVTVDVSVNDVATEKDITKNFTVPVKYTGLNSELNLESSQNEVSLTVSGTQSLVNGLSANDFTATVDLSSYKEAGTYDVTPKVTVDKNVEIQTIPTLKVTIKKTVEDKSQVKK